MSTETTDDVRVLHCWEDEREDITNRFGFGSEEWAATFQEEWVGGTCMLEAGHDGPHQFTPDDQIGVTFGVEVSA